MPLIVEPVIYWTIECTRKRFYRKPTCYPKITKLSHLLSCDWRVYITRSQSIRIFITTTMFFRISGYILNWMQLGGCSPINIYEDYLISIITETPLTFWTQFIVYYWLCLHVFRSLQKGIRKKKEEKKMEQLESMKSPFRVLFIYLFLNFGPKLIKLRNWQEDAKFSWWLCT